jgi:hypothetical protein
VNGSIIDGDGWIAERLAFLRERLDSELTEGERSAIEAEIANLSKERGIAPSGRRAGPIVRRLRRSRR